MQRDGVALTSVLNPMPGDEAQMLQQRIEALPSVTLVRMGYPSALAPTREPYEVFRFGYGKSEADAIAAIEVEITEYVNSRRGTLYWRVRPETACQGGKKWLAYARLLVSDKPVQGIPARAIDLKERIIYELTHRTSTEDLDKLLRDLAAFIDEVTPQVPRDA